MSLQLRLLLSVSILLTAINSAGPANAEGAKKPSGPWLKYCRVTDGKYAPKHSVCLTLVEKVNNKDANPQIIVALRKAQNSSKEQFMILLPPGIDRKAGMVVRFDEENGGHRLPVKKCVACGCFSQVDADAVLYRKLRKGRRLRVYANNSKGVRFYTEVTLLGFSKAYESTPVAHKLYSKRYHETRIRIFMKQGMTRNEAHKRASQKRCTAGF